MMLDENIIKKDKHQQETLFTIHIYNLLEDLYCYIFILV